MGVSHVPRHAGLPRPTYGPNDKRNRVRSDRYVVRNHAVFADGHVLLDCLKGRKRAPSHAWRLSLRRSDGTTYDDGGFCATEELAKEMLGQRQRHSLSMVTVFSGVAVVMKGAPT
jgi:hypothetical protein